MFTVNGNYPIYEISHKRVDSPDPEHYNKHIHTYCEILLFINGRADFNIDGVLYTPKPYDLIFIPNATYHYLIPRPECPYENYVLDFHPSMLSTQHYKRLFSHPLTINIKGDLEFCRFFELLDYYHSTYTPEDFNTCVNALLRELLVFCSYRLTSAIRVEAERNELVDTMLNLISENLDAPIDADFLSQKLMLSKSYIQNVFSQTMHIGLKQYITQKKIYAAQHDIIAGAASADVALKYGFSDYSVFFRLYKKTLGYTPRQTKILHK